MKGAYGFFPVTGHPCYLKASECDILHFHDRSVYIAGLDCVIAICRLGNAIRLPKDRSIGTIRCSALSTDTMGSPAVSREISGSIIGEAVGCCSLLLIKRIIVTITTAIHIISTLTIMVLATDFFTA